MNEYISREAVINITAETGAWETQNRIRELPAADVQPVKRGKWRPPLMRQGKFATYCSRCQYTVMRNSAGIFEETPFCPHCGADMRGDTND